MNVKAVVKVMNFHSLLRVDAARKRAEKYSALDAELENMMGIIMNNRNLILDKRIKLPDPDLPALRIYLGSDLGFCGSVNASVSSTLKKDAASGCEKIVIGKKLRRPQDISLFFDQAEFEARFEELEHYMERAVKERCWSSVEVVYNHFYNMTSIKEVVRRIYPLEIHMDDPESMEVDFLIEGEPTEMLESMMIADLCYELKIAAASAFASENIMRQNATSESLKKLDELEEEEIRVARKERNQVSFQKTVDSYIKQKSLEKV